MEVVVVQGFDANDNLITDLKKEVAPRLKNSGKFSKSFSESCCTSMMGPNYSNLFFSLSYLCVCSLACVLLEQSRKTMHFDR
jgi:hypothetical protein